jgi:hypothetical protein
MKWFDSTAQGFSEASALGQARHEIALKVATEGYVQGARR